MNGVTTVYLLGLYEYQNDAVTKYYEGGAMRRTGYATDNGVFYVVSDHLRSTSVLVNRDGTVKSRNFYYPYGGNRGGSAFSGVTTKRFTGQYHEQGLPGGEGLAFYNARWYDAQVGMFISADTLVPSPLAPQTFNRYAYVGGNPLRYIDPTGHYEDEGLGGYTSYTPTKPKASWPSLFSFTVPKTYVAPYVSTPGRSIVQVARSPLPTRAPLIVPAATPAGPVMQAAPTWSPTPYAGPWYAPATPRPPTATPSGPVYTPTSGRVNVSDLYWGLVVAVMNDLPELTMEYGGTTIRAAGRTYGGSEMPPLVSEGVGLLASVGPNVYANLQAGKGPGTLDFQTDLVVDLIGFGGSWGAGKTLAWAGGVGVGAITEGAGALPGAVGGYLVGSFGGSLIYDLWIGPTFVAPPVYGFLSQFH